MEKLLWTVLDPYQCVAYGIVLMSTQHRPEQVFHSGVLFTYFNPLFTFLYPLKGGQPDKPSFSGNPTNLIYPPFSYLRCKPIII